MLGRLGRGLGLRRLLFPKISDSAIVWRSVLTSDAVLGERVVVKNSSVGVGCVIGRGSELANVRLTRNVRIGSHTLLRSSGSSFHIAESSYCEIGNYTSIAGGFELREYGHSIQRPATYYVSKRFFGGNSTDDVVSNGPVAIGSDVWIGSGVLVLGGLTIGHGAVVGARSVVTKDIPPFAVVVGNPAKVIRYRFSDELISELMDMRWWNYPIEDLSRPEMAEFFCTELTSSGALRARELLQRL